MTDTKDGNGKPTAPRKARAVGAPRPASVPKKTTRASKSPTPAESPASPLEPPTRPAKPSRRKRREPASVVAEVVAEPAPKPVRPAARKKAAPRGTARRRAASVAPGEADVSVLEPPAGLTDEERIESSKYSGGRRPRLFEEERFLFPETYGTNRVRLLIKDPDWIFAYWDVDPKSREKLRDEVGERAAAVTQLTLRVWDAGNGGMMVILLPEGARSWYVRADRWRRSYRAELGLTLPSGEFRRLAESNLVITPRVGPSPDAVRRVLTYHQASEISAQAAREAAVEDGQGVDVARGPWSPAPRTWVVPESEGETPARAERGGASDAFRR